MAFTFDAKTEANATSTGLSVSHTTAASSEILVCSVAIRGTQTITSIKYNSVDLSVAIMDPGPGGDPERVAIYYLLAPSSGANNLVVALSGSVLHFVSVATFQADSGTITVDATGANSSTGVVSDPNVTLSASTGLLAVDCASSEVAASPPFNANGADQTVLHNSGSGSYGRGSSYELSPSSGEVFNWTHGPAVSDTWTHVACVFLEGTAAAPPVMAESFQAIPFF